MKICWFHFGGEGLDGTLRRSLMSRSSRNDSIRVPSLRSKTPMHARPCRNTTRPGTRFNQNATFDRVACASSLFPSLFCWKLCGISLKIEFFLTKKAKGKNETIGGVRFRCSEFFEWKDDGSKMRVSTGRDTSSAVCLASWKAHNDPDDDTHCRGSRARGSVLTHFLLENTFIFEPRNYLFSFGEGSKCRLRFIRRDYGCRTEHLSQTPEAIWDN